MKAFLMYPDADFDPAADRPWNEAALMQDLGLGPLLAAMARGDAFLGRIAAQAVLTGVTDVATILYRQAILRDCLAHRDVIREIYDITINTIDREKKEYFGILDRYPRGILGRAVKLFEIFVPQLMVLRRIADANIERFASAGFRRLFTMLREELSDDYFAEIGDHLKRLQFRRGVLISARLGKGLKGVDYVLRRSEETRWSWLRALLARGRDRELTYRLHPRDEAGARCLAELRDRGINLVANALAQSAEHVLSFFWMLRTELAFYIGCTNLHEELERRGQWACFPSPAPIGQRQFSCTGLYDPSLALTLGGKVVGNDVRADDKLLLIITGANQGGKSTFLRSVGIAQLLMQSGMFVAARSFCANLCDAVLTHYRREEDATMRSGKLDEELSRMSEIVDHMTANALVLLNESFAATNEREGSEIARQVVRALIDRGKKVVFVTHMYDLASRLHEARLPAALFLRAERQADGSRTFRLVEGEPLRTSFGADLYRRIFEAGAGQGVPAATTTLAG
jgi:hypothetical protein